MHNYVISVKAKRNASKKSGKHWLYAGTKTSLTNCPYWSTQPKQTFENVKTAEEWFQKHKTVLLGKHYEKYELDLKTLAIRKITYTNIKSLYEPEKPKWTYETGRFDPEILGSGGIYSHVYKTPDEQDAITQAVSPRNYLVRYYKDEKQNTISQQYDARTKSWF